MATRSEFAGQDGPSGMPLYKNNHLRAKDKLRLVYTTGTQDCTAPLSGRAFKGDGRFNPYVPPSRIPPLPPE